jgi:hypothetical protein
VRTPYLRLILPTVIRRVQRGETRLVVNVSKLGEFLALAQEDIDRLAPELLGTVSAKRGLPGRKRLDYLALRAQYEQLLLDGTCTTKAELARYLVHDEKVGYSDVESAAGTL